MKRPMRTNCPLFLLTLFLLSLLLASACGKERESPSPAGNASGQLFFRWPVDAPRITQDYACFDCVGTGKYHTGLDMTSAFDPVGSLSTRVVAAYDGKVILTNRSCDAASGTECGNGWGNYVVIEHDGPLCSVYAHLSDVSADRDSFVAQGQAVGVMGKTGNATGVHLHFDILDFSPSTEADMGHGYSFPSHPEDAGHRDPKGFFSHSPVTVSAANLTVYERPVSANFSSPLVITSTSPGTVFISLARGMNNWHYIYLPSLNGPSEPPASSQAVYGWIAGDEPPPVPPVSQIRVNGRSVPGTFISVHSSAGSSSQTLTRIWGNQRFASKETSQHGPDDPDDQCQTGQWVNIDIPVTNGFSNGWVCGDHLSVVPDGGP